MFVWSPSSVRHCRTLYEPFCLHRMYGAVLLCTNLLAIRTVVVVLTKHNVNKLSTTVRLAKGSNSEAKTFEPNFSQIIQLKSFALDRVSNVRTDSGQVLCLLAVVSTTTVAFCMILARYWYSFGYGCAISLYLVVQYCRYYRMEVFPRQTIQLKNFVSRTRLHGNAYRDQSFFA